jgi:anaerobic ribonucleoside-triphosphate reductase activating protein
MIDVLIDGRFMEKRKSLKAKFRGSMNQRAIDVKESIKCGKAIEINF